MKHNLKVAQSLLLAVVCLIVTVGVSACGLLDRTPTTVPDPGGIYHVNVPHSWSFSSKPGMVTLYAGSKVPENGELDKLSVVILTSALGAKSETPEPKDALEAFAKWRAESRAWKNAKQSAVQTTTLGAVPASFMDISGTDKKGVAFKGRYYLGRTTKNEVFIMAVSPADAWDNYVKQLDKILKDEWFWHS